MKPLDERGERHPKTGSPSKSGLSDAVGTPQRVEKLPVTASGPRFGFKNACFGTL